MATHTLTVARRSLAGALALFLLAGCGGDAGTAYPIPIRDVRQTLLGIEPPMEFFPADAADVRVSRDSDNRISWLLVDRTGSGLLAFVATLEEADLDETRVSIAVAPPPGGRKEDVARKLEENGAISDFYRSAMAEQVDAALEKRDFDMSVIQDEMMLAALATMPKAAKEMDKGTEKFRQPKQVMTSGDDWQDSHSDTYDPDFGEPMDDAAGSAF